MAANAQSAECASPIEAPMLESKEGYLLSQLTKETSRLNILQLRKENLILQNIAPGSKKDQLKNELSTAHCLNYFKKEIPHQIAKISLLQQQLKDFYESNEH